MEDFDSFVKRAIRIKKYKVFTIWAAFESKNLEELVENLDWRGIRIVLLQGNFKNIVYTLSTEFQSFF